LKVSKLIEQRQFQWRELEDMCSRMQTRTGKLDAIQTARFTALYRSACADLALASAYQLPPSSVDYLHKLVARAHNQLYRSRSFQWKTFAEIFFVKTPRIVFDDVCVHICFFVFWGLFLVSAYLAYETEVYPDFAERVIGRAQMEGLETSWTGFSGRTYGENCQMAGYYVLNNAGLQGLFCFAYMLLVLPGLGILVSNAVYLGAVFGFMFRPELGEASVNFKTFVTAHGPFELTAIILVAGAGLRLGLSWMMTNGLSRKDSMIAQSKKALPVVMCGVVLFCMAAFIEGFISPIPESIMPWFLKGGVAVFSCAAMLFYFVVLGYPRGGSIEA